MPRKMPETFTEEDALKLINTTDDWRKKLFYALGFYQALRISEIAGLKPEYLDFENNMIYIREARTPSGLPKKQVQRHIPMAPEIKPLLQMYGCLLPFEVVNRTMQQWIGDDSVAVLGKYYHAHNLRHSGATHYHHIMGWPLDVVKVFLGHAGIESTQVYISTSPAMLKEWMGVA